MNSLIRAALIAACLLFNTANAASVAFDFSFENDGNLFEDSFGIITVSDDETDQLSFTVEVDTSILGAGSDLEQVGFNLDFSEQVSLVSGTNNATLSEDASVKGRNSTFDFLVDFGQGQPFFDSVAFVIEGSGLDLSAFLNADLSTQNSKPDANFMAHVQSTSTSGGSESIGGVVPVPAAVWLFGSALGLLGWVRRKRA